MFPVSASATTYSCRAWVRSTHGPVNAIMARLPSKSERPFPTCNICWNPPARRSTASCACMWFWPIFPIWRKWIACTANSFRLIRRRARPGRCSFGSATVAKSSAWRWQTDRQAASCHIGAYLNCNQSAIVFWFAADRDSSGDCREVVPVLTTLQPEASRQRMKTAAQSALALLLLLLVSPIPASAQAPSKVSVVLNFAADGGAAGFYHALERGYFRELGLDVTIEPSKGSADAITRTASQASDIGIGDVSTLVEFASRRPEIAPKAVFILHNRSPQAVIALKSSGIAKLTDLHGRILGRGLADAPSRMF